MQRIVLDTNAVIMHGRSFPERARSAAKQGKSVILPSAVKTELVDDVLTVDDAPANHRESAQTIQNLVDEGILTVREPDFDRYGTIADEARKRIADESLPEHAVKAD
jgi:predicted nucleic acid-binding protein